MVVKAGRFVRGWQSLMARMQTREGTRPMRATIRHRGVQRQDGRRPVRPSCREGLLRSTPPENTWASTRSSHIRPFRQKGPTGDSGGPLQTMRPDVFTNASDIWPTLAIPPSAICSTLETMEHAFSPRFFPNNNLLAVKKKPSIGTEKCLVNQTKSRFLATLAIFSSNPPCGCRSARTSVTTVHLSLARTCSHIGCR